MEQSDSELRGYITTKISANNPRLCSPDVTVNRILLDDLHQDGFTPNHCTDLYLLNPTVPCRAGQVSRGFGLPAHAACSEDRGGSEAGMKLHLGDRRWESCYWRHVANRDNKGTEEINARKGSEDKYSSQTESDEEDLEPPLPLRSDEELQDYSPVLPPNHYMHRCGLHHAVEGRQYNFDPVSRHPPQSYPHFAPCQHRKAWFDTQSWLRSGCDMVTNDGLAPGGVSVNVPQFFVPPVESMSQVSVASQNPAEEGGSVSHWREKRQTISMPTVSRNVFVTYSSDISSEILPFADFLTKHGFWPAIDIFDNPVRCMDINKWKDHHLKDPSTLIIIAISPKYKEDIEGFGADSHSLHTRYIYAMMQNEFIQQGSLNFRFIPVLFLNASQKHVPTWLQNTRVYRWPQDTEDLLLRLLREEKYIPPPVPVELTLLIKPVLPSSAAGL